jgi:lipopolysaccharide transport system ATP-binding protein
MKPILEVQHIGKKFFIGGQQEPYLSLRDVLSNPFKKFKQPKQESFLALDDINFDVMPGQSIGIIGRNGAGKSTLLKILSKITPPSSGKIICRGRIASLLEVGTGFHPELTGRENIYMNGSILGMRKAEINKHFDAIVEFSGVAQFLDTPLKRYSSGMQLRLAFAVAAHLEPEILVIDEVLAVGDAEFQKKCLGKMNEVSKSGRTVIFVSHDMGAVQTLCSNSILLNKGKILETGKTEDIIGTYLSNHNLSEAWEQTKEMAKPHISKVNVSLLGSQPNLILVINFTIKSPVKMDASFVAFDIANKMGTVIGQAIPQIEPFIQLNNEEKNYKVEIELNGFVPDDYTLSVWIGAHNTYTYDWQKEIIGFTIVDSPQQNRVFPHSRSNGNIVPNSKIIFND